MTNRPTLYVAVRADYSQYQKDLAQVRAVAKQEGQNIAAALDGAISPGKAQRSLTTITNSLRVLGQQGGKVNLDHVTDGLAQLAKQAGVSTAKMEALTQSMAENARAQAMQKALSDLQKQTGMSTLELAKLQASLGDVSGAFGTLARGAKGAAVAAAAFAVGLGEVTRMSLEAQLELDRLRVSYSSVFGDAGAQEQLQVIYDQVNRVGLKYVETAEAAKSFFAAGQNTPLQNQLNQIFTAMTNTGAALQLTTDDMNGAFIALGQMMSKGKISSEELRQQMGEQLPVALQAMAKAAGVSMGELDKLLQQGQLMSADILPKFADALNELIPNVSTDNLESSINRLQNTFTDLVNSSGVQGFYKRAVELVDSLLQFTGWHKVRLTAEGKIEKDDPRLMLTCSAVAKGYAVDVIAGLLRRKGVGNFMVDIGGEVVVSGRNPSQERWRIGINKPVDDSLAVNQELQTVLHITNAAMATSGNYRNFYYKGGKKYAHTIDPRTGYPIQHEILSATVIARDCMSADAYPTAFMVMGLQQTVAFAEAHPELEVYLIYATPEGRTAVYHTPGMSRYLEKG